VCSSESLATTDRTASFQATSPEREKRYSSTLSLTSALDGCRSNAKPPSLCSKKREVNPCIGGLLDARAGLHRCGKSRSQGDSVNWLCLDLTTSRCILQAPTELKNL
jgi:hypothetical protein